MLVFHVLGIPLCKDNCIALTEMLEFLYPEMGFCVIGTYAGDPVAVDLVWFSLESYLDKQGIVDWLLSSSPRLSHPHLDSLAPLVSYLHLPNSSHVGFNTFELVVSSVELALFLL